MQRRCFLLATTGLAVAGPALAHHGWSSFDQARPLWLQGKALNVAWRNPHAELDLELAPNLKLPADLADQRVPGQSAPVDGPGLMKAAQLPTRRDRRWHLELAPISRLESWKVPPVKNGDELAVLGFTFTGEKGDAVLRVEYLFLAGGVYGLRSSPA